MESVGFGVHLRFSCSEGERKFEVMAFDENGVDKSRDDAHVEVVLLANADRGE